MQLLELVGALFLASSLCTLTVHGLVIIAVVLERKRVAVNAFYPIYLTGCFSDTISLMNGVFTYCTFTGFLQAHLASSLVILQISQIIVWGSRITQMITVLLIATNRVTAIRYPLNHLRIWKSTTQRVCSFLQISSMFAFSFAFVSYLRPHPIPSKFGGVITVYGLDSEQLTAVFFGATVTQSTNALLVLLLYMTILRDVRQITKASQTHYNVEVSSVHTYHKLKI
ncbi:hypothetical protein PENTCL1PPCAC_15706 [Pristionchus entomophagus]|uniref:G protein-coupled receptor n=1 Tax=Pristionchus entomophagus TaxID=358040 RepID=A0AAV5TH07_9BILA|nr:hypothetical protein PENTCL1PPCAC_15706 [Pristionchus entomophagus]